MTTSPLHSPKNEDFVASQKPIDVVEVEQIEGTVRLFDSEGNIRKVPVPSNDPADPLTWSSWKRCLVLMSLSVFGVAGFGVIQSTPLFFGQILAEYERETRGRFNVPDIGQLASYPSLCMGVGNFLFVPLSMMLGRRAVFLFCNVLMFVAIIWASKSNGFNSHLGARCLQGLTCRISDCLLPIMVLDMTFLHRRGVWMSIYWAGTAAGSTALLVVVPFVVQAAGSNWRINYWFWSGFSALSLILAIFCLPETFFPRAPHRIDGQLVITDQYGNVTVIAAEDAPEFTQGQLSPEEEPTQSESYLRALRPIKLQQQGFKRFLTTYAEMSLSLLNPSIVWVLILNALLFGGLVAQSLTYTTQLVLPPWNFSSAAVGTAQAGSFFGVLVALGLSGITVDRISGFITKRNGGVREAEHILPNFILPSCLAFAGLVLYGTVAGNPEKYPGAGWIGIHISFGLYYFSNC